MGWQQDFATMWAYIRHKQHHTVGRAQNDIVRSGEDRRTYRGLTLANGLRLLLISDPTTDKAAAALDVHVGHLSDPDDLPGLAHLCEHMLFMGTKKSKEVDEYKRFLSEHGGSSNAFTSMEHTNYHFDISASHLQQALHRFSKFIRQPQFDSQVIEREVNVVDSENEKNISNDQWRLFQLTKSTSDSNHPYNKFGTGNKETLLTNPQHQGINVYKKLVNFHRKFYSANIMCLAVLGKDTLDDLEASVVPLFVDVQNNSIDLPVCQRTPYGPAKLKVQLNVVPLKNMENMLLTWPIHDLMPLYKEKPGHYLGYMLSFQGPGSLFADLKTKGWINQLVAANKTGGRGFMFFCVSMDLTEEGYHHTNAIISEVFRYVNMLKKEGITERMYNECSAFKALRFRFKEKEPPRDYVSECAEILHLFPFVDVLCGPWLLSMYSEKEIRAMLNKINPDNIRVLVQSKRFAGETDLTEPWYGTEYSEHIIPEQTIKEWRTVPPSNTFHLPPVNEFIPSDLLLETVDAKNPHWPAVIHVCEMARLWFRQDDCYLLPKTSITVQLTRGRAAPSPEAAACEALMVQTLQDGMGMEQSSLTIPSANLSAGGVAELDLSMDLLADRLQPLCQPAEWAGLFVDVFLTPGGITLALNGYSDKIDVLLERAVRSLATFRVDPCRYGPIKEKYMQTLSNFEMEQPHKQASQLVNIVTSQRTWTKAAMLNAAKDVTVKSVQACLRNFLSVLHLEVLIYGNVTEKLACTYLRTVTEVLKAEANTKPLSESLQHKLRELQFPKGVTLYRHLSTTPRETNAVAMYYQCGPQSTRTNVLLELFYHLTHQHCYDVLRTRDQLGYIVMYSIRRSKGSHGLRIIVQSHYPPPHIQMKITAFVEDLEEYLKNVSPERYANQRAALKLQRLECPKRMVEQNARYWTEITSNLHQFNRDEIEAAEVSTLKQEEVTAFYKEHIRLGGTKQRTLSVHVTPSSSPCDESQMTEIKSLDEFKLSLPAYPAPEPALQTDTPNLQTWLASKD